MANKRYQLPGPMPGQSYFIVDTAAEAITGPAAGDLKYALDTDLLYSYDGAVWNAAGGGAAANDVAWVFATKVHPETGIGRAMFAPYAATIMGIYAWCTDSLPSSTMTADLLLEGTSVGGTKPTVTAGNDVGSIVTDQATTAVAQLDKLAVEIEATGGSDGRIFVAVLVQPA